MATTYERTYEELRERFRWHVPADFNIGVACADRQPAGRTALIDVKDDGTHREYSFGELAKLSNHFANALLGLAVRPGDRVAIMLSQRSETGIAHLSVYKLGGIAVPLSVLFGFQALRYRLNDSGAKVVITDAAHVDIVEAVARELGGLEIVIVDGQPGLPHHGMWDLIGAASDSFAPAQTGPDTPALLIYTSGTMGVPKGALHGHRVLLGTLPGFELSHDFFPQPGDRFWTPADWAWLGGLMDGLLPSWYHGQPIIAASRHGFDPDWALQLMADREVRNAFLPPTALKMMRQADARHPGVRLRSMMSGGEYLGEEMLAWTRERFGLTVNELYGQTEVNDVVGNCSKAWEARAGSIGRPYPGHDVVLLDGDEPVMGTSDIGEIAVRAPNPVMFLEYWGRPDATREKYTSDGRWLRSGDLARIDDDGYFWFESRADDVISSSGYRIGPAEIEECLLHHPAVAMAAAIGVPDPMRGQVVKAFIQLTQSSRPSPELEAEIRNLVRARLAAYEYPRQIEFVERLPLTTTGKVRRAELRDQEDKKHRESPEAGGPK